MLGVLQAQPLHGYEITKRIRELSDGALSYGDGQLYPVLHELEQAEWVSAEFVDAVNSMP